MKKRPMENVQFICRLAGKRRKVWLLTKIHSDLSRCTLGRFRSFSQKITFLNTSQVDWSSSQSTGVLTAASRLEVDSAPRRGTSSGDPPGAPSGMNGRPPATPVCLRVAGAVGGSRVVGSWSLGARENWNTSGLSLL